MSRSGCCQCAIYRPSTIQSSLQSSVWDIKFTRPFSKAHGFAVMCYVSVSARIRILLCPRSPTTIASFIMSIIVNPINRVFPIWSVTNVIKKITKRSIKNLYSSAAITVIVFVGRVAATFNHGSVCNIFSCSASAVYVSFFSVRVHDKTSTRRNTAGTQGGNNSNFLGSANTYTKPLDIPSFAPSNGRNSSKPAKSLTQYIFCVFMKWYNFVCHFVTSNNMMNRDRLFTQPVLHYNRNGDIYV